MLLLMNNDIDCTFLQNQKVQKPRYGVGEYCIIDGQQHLQFP
jgi:hypothetical protein